MFGIDIFDASLMTAMMLALFAGVLSFLSPCVLPIVPPYIAYMGGLSMKDMTAGDLKQGQRKAILAAVFFALGLSTVFVLLGAAASALGQFFLTNQRLFAQIAGVVILIFGLHFMGVFKIGLLYREARFDARSQKGSLGGSYIMGLAFAFGWTPCIGPILGAILALSAQEESVARGTVLMTTYAIGLGIPFILVSMFIQRSMGLINRFKKHMGKIEFGMGLLLVVIGIAMFTGAFEAFSLWILEQFPALAQIG
ncbi:MAG: cytochrome c biogenesis protein CcdA [Pseudomonadota bacterium]